MSGSWANFPPSSDVYYNGWVFDPLYRSKMRGRVIYDDAGIIPVCTEFELSVQAMVTSAGPPNGTNINIATMRQQLQTAGAELRYSNKGMATSLVINAAAGGGLRDVRHGPRPVTFEFVPVGDANAAMVTWAVTFCIPEDCSSPVTSGRPMACNWDQDFSLDANGYTTMRIAGYIEIPMSRATAASRTFPDQADAYRERIYPSPPAGFRPVERSFHLSADRKRLDFSLTFQEIPNDGLPVYCTSANGSHSVRPAGPMGGGMARWNARIDASYVVARTESKQRAYANFFALALDRIRRAGKSALLTSLSFSDGLYLDSPKVGCSIEYSFPSSLGNILQSSGIWQPVPNTNQQQWATSVNAALAARGFAGLRHNLNDSAVVNLCGGTATLRAGGGQINKLLATNPFTPTLTTVPPPDLSWILFRNVLEVRMLRNGIARHKPLSPVLQVANFPGGPVGLSGGNPSPGSGGSTLIALAGQQVARPAAASMQSIQNVAGADQTGFATMVSGGTPDDVAQLLTTPTFEITLRGQAVRAGYPVTVPVLIYFGGQVLVPKHTDIRNETVGRFLVPLFQTDWILRYETFGVPEGNIGYPSNLTSFIS